MWYLVCILIGLIAGYVIKDLISPEVVIKGKVKQRGKNNTLSVKPDIEVKKQRSKRLFRRKNKKAST